MKPSRNRVNLLRASVNHHSFVTGLQAKLSGKGDGHVQLNVILGADVAEGVKVVTPRIFSLLEPEPYHNVLQGQLFQCGDFLSFVGGTYDEKTLNESKFSNSPTEFTIETWECENVDLDALEDLEDKEFLRTNPTQWKMKRKTNWGGVKWLNAAHTGDGGDRTCAGIATFTCNKKEVVEIKNGEMVVVPIGTRYPHIELRRILQQQIVGPKHSPNYLG